MSQTIQLTLVLQAVSNPNINRPLNWIPPSGITTAIDTFVGYLLFDAWIGNSDRHHENWGFVETFEQSVHLALTYDHASCLGRELLDSKRQERIQNSSVDAYINQARSALYANSGDKKALLTMDAFSQSAQQFPKAASIWLEQLEKITPAHTEACLSRIPSHRISSVAVEFAHQVLNINHIKLLRLRETFF